jgi:hypothetical protein
MRFQALSGSGILLSEEVPAPASILSIATGRGMVALRRRRAA